jgi:KaiC/GvpD/RAD55 family RecA-like ATPase
MGLDNFTIQQNEIAELRKVHYQTYIKSSWQFISQVHGLRPKCLHLILAPTHAGKTTFVLSLKRDLYLNNQDKKILCYYSEESKADVRTKFAMMFDGDVNADCIDAIYELEEKMPEVALFEYLEIMQPSVFIFDNLTTSKLYNDKNSKAQFEFTVKLKECCQRNNIALICIAHTGDVTNLKGKLIDENDIRGSKNIPNMAEHLWVLQPIDVGNARRTFLRVLKHRGYDVKNKLFRLGFNSEKQMIHDIMPVDFEEFKKVFALRNKL